MKKIILIIVAIFFTTSAISEQRLKFNKDGFISKDFKLTELSTIQDPKNKIIIINNHGQNVFDGKQKDCTDLSQIRNRISLVGEEINGKKIMLYNLCAHHI